MENKARFLFTLGFWVLISLNVFIFFKVQQPLVENKKALDMIIRMNAVRGKLSLLESEIWNIVYQPSTSREVLNGRSKGYQTILKDIRMDLEAAKAYSHEDKPRQQIELVRRSVDSLTRKADRLRAQIVLQSIDMDSTKIFFQDTNKTSMLAESHVVEMEEIMKRLNDNIEVVNDNISQYAQEEVLVAAQMAVRGLKEYRYWVCAMILVNGCFLLAGAWLVWQKRRQA
jgi:hypothetical protein